MNAPSAVTTPATTRRGSNLPRVGDYNQVVVLEAIRRNVEGLSRVEVAGLTGLSPQTVSNICRRLLETGLVEEAGKRGVGPGKPRTLLRLAPRGRFAVGVHLDPALMTFVVLDLVGRPVARSVRPLRPGLGPEQVLGEVAQEVAALVAASGVDPERIVGLGVAAPGPVDATTGTLMRPPNLPGWDRVAVRDVLADATGLSVLLDKDVVAAVVAELWSGAIGGPGSAAFFYIGTGVGAGLVLHGEVHRGTSGNAGEMGHLITGPDGPPCSCGQRGCIGEVCSPRTVVETARRRGIVGLDAPVEAGAEGSAPREDADHRDVVGDALGRLCAIAADGNADALELLEDMAVRFAKAASDVVNLLDIDQVVFGGPLWEHLAPVFLRVVPELIRSSAVATPIHPVTVRGTSVGADVAAVGAACLVLDQAFSPRSATLLVTH
ncbi:MAG TPA: ROK family protein [Humibacillus xanthopallidus]|nr:ROK family protein [Humibacillus xanthopallidus]